MTWRRVIHARCGYLAFYTSQEAFRPGDYLRSSNVRLGDGSAPRPSDLACCWSCGELVTLRLDDYRIEPEPVAL